jgi:hypothetical protein
MNETQNLDFAGKVGGARALIEAVPAKKGPASVFSFSLVLTSQLRAVRDVGKLVLRDMNAILDLSDESQTDDLLYRTLTSVTWIVDSMTFILDEGTKMAAAERIPASDWPPGLITEIRELVEEFEDIQEALGLGLSDEFKKQVELAKADALR